jgi:hypothetical protein
MQRHNLVFVSFMSPRWILSQDVSVDVDFLCDAAAMLGDIMKETPVLVVYLKFWRFC